MQQKQIILSKICDQAFELYNYAKIMFRLKNIKSITTDEDFQKLYNAYYDVRRNEKWRKSYYTLFQKCREPKNNITFEYILRKLSDDVNTGFTHTFALKIYDKPSILEFNTSGIYVSSAEQTSNGGALTFRFEF